MHRPKKTLSSEVLVKNRWFSVRQDTVERANGKRAPYYSIVSDPFVIICALSDDGKSVTMVKNWRYPIRRYLWEFPMGWRERNETPLMAAKRELQEETGLQAKRWKSLGWFYLAPGISTQRGYVFLAERVTRTVRVGKNEEVVAVKQIPLKKLQAALASTGGLLDAPTRVAVQSLINAKQSV